MNHTEIVLELAEVINRFPDAGFKMIPGFGNGDQDIGIFETNCNVLLNSLSNARRRSIIEGERR